jgi:YVTN family beta-propeller protein
MALPTVWFPVPVASSRSPLRNAAAGAAAAVLLLSSCSVQASRGVATSEGASTSARTTSPVPVSTTSSGPTAPTSTTSASSSTPPARAKVLNVYAGAGAGKLSATAKRAKSLVYVPNNTSDTVQVIDPKTLTVIDTYPTGRGPHHVVPSWDLKTLWVNDTVGGDLLPIDPNTGKPGKRVHVEDPYNLYFTPDGTHALVMAERLRRIDVVNPHTMALERSLPVPCKGVNHADYSADLSFFVASCEFSGNLLVIDRQATKVIKVINLNDTGTPRATSAGEAMRMGGAPSNLMPGASAMPQDVRLTPDGTRFLVADMLRNGIWVIKASTRAIERFIPTGKGAHGIYPDREGRRIFVTNRDEGSISVLDASSLAITATWRIPGGGSPDMGGITADGSQLWLSGRYHSEVYVFDTRTGALIKRIKVNGGPHGLLVWPQPGSFSLGHTGNMR